ncbi:hypothetical protein QI226_11230 [Staphylococcus saprophyticus]|nr:hypothetical protein [Staphylococcus saprophyticus]
MSYERTTKDSVEYIANKFAENPGHFAATILRMYWDMEKQRDQYKAERDTLNSKLNQSYEDNYKLEGQLHDMTKQRNTLIDDVKNLREQCKEYVQDASKYTILTNHIRMKAENNPGVSRYIDLVNYIDRLERGDGEKI